MSTHSCLQAHREALDLLERGVVEERGHVEREGLDRRAGGGHRRDEIGDDEGHRAGHRADDEREEDRRAAEHLRTPVGHARLLLRRELEALVVLVLLLDLAVELGEVADSTILRLGALAPQLQLVVGVGRVVDL